MPFSDWLLSNAFATCLPQSSMLDSDDADMDFVFHMFFMVKYCKALEEGSFRGKSADFLWMLLFGESLLTMPCT